MNLDQSLLSSFHYEIKKSKFISLIYQVNSKEEFEILYHLVKKEHHKARHICYVYQIGTIAKYYDDREPKGTAGKPLYQLVNQYQLDQIVIFVIRYFGGIKLGASGLIRAYVKSANEAIKQLKI